jgi:hypothetical protein
MENFALLPHRAEAHTTVLSKPVGQRLRACPDADCILSASAIQWNSTEVLDRNQPQNTKEFLWQE